VIVLHHGVEAPLALLLPGLAAPLVTQRSGRWQRHCMQLVQLARSSKREPEGVFVAEGVPARSK
jgi:hypothetical protein